MSESKIGLEPGYQPYVINTYEIKNDITITVVNNKPERLLKSIKPILFEGKDEYQKYFSIFNESDKYYKIIVYNQVRKNHIQQVALLNKNLDEWMIFKEADNEDATIYPLAYPLGPLIFYYITAKHNAIMIHASGVLEGNKGRLYTGFSGRGKTTMAQLWLKHGGIAINDDRLIIRKEKNGYFMHNTPMFYVDNPKAGHLSAIYIIEHSTHNQIKRINGIHAVSRLMAFCIHHDYDQKTIQHHLDIVNDLCDCLPVYHLGFIPDESIIDFINENGN